MLKLQGEQHNVRTLEKSVEALEKDLIEANKKREDLISQVKASNEVICSCEIN